MQYRKRADEGREILFRAMVLYGHCFKVSREQFAARGVQRALKPSRSFRPHEGLTLPVDYVVFFRWEVDPFFALMDFPAVFNDVGRWPRERPLVCPVFRAAGGASALALGPPVFTANPFFFSDSVLGRVPVAFCGLTRTPGSCLSLALGIVCTPDPSMKLDRLCGCRVSADTHMPCVAQSRESCLVDSAAL
jgi:hypothetical protein